MNNSDPQKLKDLLYVYGFLVRYRIIPASEVIQWVDFIVMQEDEPDYFFIELSLCGSPNAMDSCLNEFLRDYTSLQANRAILGVLYQRLSDRRVSLEQALSVLNYRMIEELSSQEFSMFYYLDHEYYLAKDGLKGTIEEVFRQTLELLGIYKEFRFDNHMEWERISEEIDKKLLDIAEKMREESHRISNNTNPWWKFWCDF